MNEEENFHTGKLVLGNLVALIPYHSQEVATIFNKDNPKNPDISTFYKISMAYI